MARKLEGKVAVVTGASSGIGKSIVEKYVEEGARVVAFARNLDALKALEASYPGQVMAVVPHIRKGGSIQFITTFLTEVGFPGLAIYSDSKAALKSLSQTLAAELAPQGIRVNSIAPGPIGTPLWGTVGLPPAVSDEKRVRVRNRPC